MKPQKVPGGVIADLTGEGDVSFMPTAPTPSSMLLDSDDLMELAEAQKRRTLTRSRVMTNKGLREKVKDLQKQLLDLESLCRETLNVNAIYAVQVARIQMERVDAQLARNEKRAKLEPKPGEWIGMSEVAKELRYYADKADAKTAERMEQIAARVERLSRNQTEKKQIKKRRV